VLHVIAGTEVNVFLERRARFAVLKFVWLYLILLKLNNQIWGDRAMKISLERSFHEEEEVNIELNIDDNYDIQH